VISHAGHPELALYSLGTGKLLVRRPHEGSARMVCDDGRGLLLAGPSPKLLSLPSGRLIWEGPKGLRSIDDLAVTRNTLFWRDGRTALIWTMALPKSAGKPLPR
jgi:hypothetical protein